jgi:type VI secretion system protein VasD
LAAEVERSEPLLAMKVSGGTSRRDFLSVTGLGAACAMLGSALGATACAPPMPAQRPDPCKIQTVTLSIYADELINPNEAEQPRPVAVRLYQLTTDTKVLNARYDDLLLKDKETLGDQMLKVYEFEIFPNDIFEVKFERIPEATILAGVAFFHTPVGQSYKTFYEFPPMPDTPEACAAQAAAEGKGAKDKEKPVPQAFPETSFFIRERKLDNGSEFEPAMFPNATKFRRLNLPKASAERASQQTFSAPSPK